MLPTLTTASSIEMNVCTSPDSKCMDVRADVRWCVYAFAHVCACVSHTSNIPVVFVLISHIT